MNWEKRMKKEVDPVSGGRSTAAYAISVSSFRARKTIDTIIGEASTPDDAIFIGCSNDEKNCFYVFFMSDMFGCFVTYYS